MFIGYAFTLIVTRKLGASAWGIFALCFTILQIASVFGRIGLDTALLRFIPQYNAQGKGKTIKDVYKKAVIMSFSFSLILSFFLYFSAFFIAQKVFNKAYLSYYIKLVSIGVPIFVLLTINSESFRALKKIKEYVFFNNILQFLIALLIFILFIIFWEPSSTKIVFWCYLTGLFLSFLISVFFIEKELKNIRGNGKLLSIKYILSVSFSMLMSSSLSMVMSWADTIMLGIWRSEKEVGIYNVAIKLSMITSFSLAAINSIAAPKFAEFWGKKDLEGLKKIAQQSTKLIFWTTAPILLVYLLFPQFFMGLFGEEFKKGAIVLVILTIGQFVNAICGSVGYILQMTGREIIVRNVIFITALLNIFLNFLFIPKYGMIGASLASSFCLILWNVIFLIYIKIRYNFWTFGGI